MSRIGNQLWPRRTAWLFVPALLIAFAGSARAQFNAPPRRARPPNFSKSIEDAFFPDARKVLVGARPVPAKGEKSLTATPALPSQAPQSPVGDGWSKSITSEVLEDEIKNQQIELAATVRNPTQFKAGDYRQARTQLSVLATMFGIVAKYDGSVRWQREAAAVRDMVARAGFNCKVGTDGSYKEAKQRSDDLQMLVRGGAVQLPEPAADVAWSSVADRAELMKRLEQAQQQGVGPLTADKRQFERQADTLAHEAQLIAALAEVISRDGYEYADDETYLEYARAMKAHAISLRDAARAQNYEQARQAAGEIGKACSNCHEGYRG